MNRKMNSCLGAAAVALLLGGSTAAHAVRLVAESGDDPLSTDAAVSMTHVTYAKETFLKSPTAITTMTGGTTTFYNIGRDHYISAPAEISAEEGDTYYVTYTLTGMVFADDLTASSLSEHTVTGTGDARAVVDTDATGSSFVKSLGMKGNSQVAFRLSEGAIASNTVLQLTAKFAMAGDGSGTISRTVTNATVNIPGFASTKTHTASIIMVKPALRETVKPADATPTARAASEFMTFGGTTQNPILSATLGTMQLGVAMPALRHAQETAAGTADDLTADPPTPGDDGVFAHVTALAHIATPDATAPYDNSVTVAGNVSFVDSIGFGAVAAAEGTADCDTVTDTRKPATAPATGFTDEIVMQNAMEGTRALCITVDGKTAIMAGSYTVTTKYKGLANALYPPAGSSQTIGSIKRDGTTVHIPLLNLSEGYNHRIILRNHSSSEVPYSMRFSPEAGTMATPGAMASGMVGAGATMFLRARDVVMLQGMQRTAATLTAPVAKGLLDVSTSLTNLETRDNDTETHAAE